MIFFIISAFSKNIAAERLAVIGTLRSIGAEKRTASLTLLIECALYGIFGGILGTVLFYALKSTLLGNMIPRTEGIGGSVHAPLYVPVIGLVISAVISSAVSLVSVIRTSKMPVRDIIFSGRDSVYKPNFFGAFTEILLLFGAFILFFGSFGFIFLRLFDRNMPYSAKVFIRSFCVYCKAYRRRQISCYAACADTVGNKKDRRHGNGDMHGGRNDDGFAVYSFTLG